MKNRLLIFLTFLLISGNLRAQSPEDRFRHVVDSFYKAIPGASGIMVHIEAPDKHISWTHAVGYTDKNTKQPLTQDQPVLIASNVKTYVAAAILRLAEQKKFMLDDPIMDLISNKSKGLLINDGYDLGTIKIKHLLSHTSGIHDYTGDDYFDFVNTHRKYHWTRDEQIKRSVDIGSPLAKAGDTFKYADVNYLLLTEVIEKFTNKPFYLAIRQLLDYKKLGLHNTWFVDLENKPKNTPALAHQYWSKYPWDSYELDPSWDLYGGGGIATDTKDLAIFYQRLFEGKIVRDKQLLAKMYTDELPAVAHGYCLGVRRISIAGFTGYYHGGFWGTDAAYFPGLNATVVIFILQKDEREKGGAICKELVQILNN